MIFAPTLLPYKLSKPGNSPLPAFQTTVPSMTTLYVISEFSLSGSARANEQMNKKQASEQKQQKQWTDSALSGCAWIMLQDKQTVCVEKSGGCERAVCSQLWANTTMGCRRLKWCRYKQEYRLLILHRYLKWGVCEEKYVSSECNKMSVNVNIFLIRKHTRFACLAPKYFHTILHNLLSYPDFENGFDYTPFQEHNKDNHWYENFMSGNWCWRQAVHCISPM